MRHERVLSFPKSVILPEYPVMRRWGSISLSAIMLYPREQDEKNFKYFIARNLLSSVPYMANFGNGPEHDMGRIFYKTIQLSFQHWEAFEEALLGHKIPAKGKGSLQDRASMGYAAGSLFRLAFNQNISLTAAAKLKKEVISQRPDLMKTVGFPSSENLINNIWPQYKDVAHFWAALLSFDLPGVPDKYIQLDKAVPVAGCPAPIPHGLEGILELADWYYEKVMSDELRSKQSRTPLLNPETAIRVAII